MPNNNPKGYNQYTKNADKHQRSASHGEESRRTANDSAASSDDDNSSGAHSRSNNFANDPGRARDAGSKGGHSH